MTAKISKRDVQSMRCSKQRDVQSSSKLAVFVGFFTSSGRYENAAAFL
jgi:hypothetical protein